MAIEEKSDKALEQVEQNVVKPIPKKRGRRKGTKKRRKAIGKRTSTEGKKAAARFPRTTFENALVVGEAIQQHAAGQKIRRLTLFEKMDKSPESGPSRMMVTNSGGYGISVGGYTAEFIELTEMGQKATSPENSPAGKAKARFQLAIAGIPAFYALYELNKGKRLPSPEVMRDSLADIGVEEARRKECVEIFLENAKFVGLLRTSAGAERLVSIEQLLDDLETSTPLGPGSDTSAANPENAGKGVAVGRDLKKVCFVIGPIGEEGDEERKHSDMVLESLIERALEGGDLEVIRADKIGDPGMISGQVIEHLLNAALVIADLSFHNPNVFYELAIRHMAGLPTVHIIRKQDQIPFDVKDFRTIHVDTGDKYDLVAKLDTYRAEISNHVRIALSAGTEGSNPVKIFAKNFVVDSE